MTDDLLNVYFDRASPRVIGYRGFFSLILVLWKANRGNKKWRFRSTVTVTLPIRWFA